MAPPPGSTAIKGVQLLVYFVFGLLLNSVGVVIMQVVHQYDVPKASASTLEGFKDIPLAAVSFFIAPYIAAVGCRRALLAALAAVGAMCFVMAAAPSFAVAKAFFLTAGCSFALVKVSVYASIGLLTADEQEHAAFLNTVEGAFMLGVLAGYFVFSLFIDPEDPARWTEVYKYLCGLCAAAFACAAATPFAALGGGAEPAPRSPRRLRQDGGFLGTLALLRQPAVLLFVAAAFVYVLIEQGVGTWLPTFNKEVLRIPPDVSVQLTSIFAAGLAAGRLGAGLLLKFVRWDALLYGCLCMAAAVIATALRLAAAPHPPVVTRADAPAAALVFPCVGLFLAPVYPALVSVVLSSLPKERHAPLTGLVTMFSAFGGTTGSLITGAVFAHFDGRAAFSLALPALAALACLVRAIHRRTAQRPAEPAEEASELVVHNGTPQQRGSPGYAKSA
eukprot:TRINITY_DN23149_c0_g1_i1.p1 TRINITY_DN23149_c0_g1~~TRINITY_DN23149_c0_g1_i1.p1  ORF type:complete len:446 (+),score=161.97 TRINITY_DN23149_c0_g1_i1:59-1396(+)